MENNNESKIRKVLFNEIFLLITIITAIAVPIYAFANIRSDIRILNNSVKQIERGLEKETEWKHAILGKISILERNILILKTKIK